MAAFQQAAIGAFLEIIWKLSFAKMKFYLGNNIIRSIVTRFMIINGQRGRIKENG